MRAILLLLAAAFPLCASPRVFTDTKGRPLTAELVQVKNGVASLRLEGGKISKVSLNRLSAKDQEWIKTWVADQVPRMEIDVDFVRGTSTDRDYFEKEATQTYEMSVELNNFSSTKDLEEAEVIYYLIGRSIKDRNLYKVLARQVATLSVPAKGKKTIRFKKIENIYRTDTAFSDDTFSQGHKGLGYVLHIRRKRDERLVHLGTGTASLDGHLDNIIRLGDSDITGPDFLKIPDKKLTPSGIPKKDPNVITIK
ncbi:MAG: hypothetical protein ACSHYF_16065 [Verrucomicrobiaceae bacterium]